MWGTIADMCGKLKQTMCGEPEQTYVWNPHVWGGADDLWGTRLYICGKLEQTYVGNQIRHV